MMYGLLHGKVPIGGFKFDVQIMDVEELNVAAHNAIFDVTKLSFKTYYDVSSDYELLDSGAALGRGNGPLLISNKPLEGRDLSTFRIAVPGMNTTATFLLQFAYPNVVDLKPMLFSDIESAISRGEVDAGVIIHETRFMYASRGFDLIDDLGAVWEEKTEMPIPLGCFAIKKTLDPAVKKSMNQLIFNSICFADENYGMVLPYIKSHAQELEENVIRQHIDMFVNEYSKGLGEFGRGSIQRLFQELNHLTKNNRLPAFI
jgi:1,4-dihydroxy-6-naphthoate synthase